MVFQSIPDVVVCRGVICFYASIVEEKHRKAQKHINFFANGTYNGLENTIALVSNVIPTFNKSGTKVREFFLVAVDEILEILLHQNLEKE